MLLRALCFAALTCATFGLASTGMSADERPNIVLIYTDDQDLDEIGCYGGKMPTPHMDGLARDGMKFTRYYVCSAVCAPSRYNVLSGRCASRSSRQQGRKYPPGGPVNIGWEAGIVGEPHNVARVLQSAGYATGMVGKWHQGQLGRIVNFDESARPDDPAVVRQLAENYDEVIRSIKSCGFDYAAAAYQNNVDGATAGKPHWLPRALGRHNMEWVAAAALEFLEAKHDRPFFLYMAPTLVHSPSAVKSLQSDPRTTPLGYIDIRDVMPSRESVMERARAVAAKNPGLLDKAAGSIWLDDGVGAILDKLDALGLRENTLVILASDNGNVAKFSCYDGGARLPMVARWPGVVPAGAVCDELVTNLDFAPTLFAAAGATIPGDMILDGRDITAALIGDPSYERSSLFLEITTERAVVTEDGFKYIAVRYLPEVQKLVDLGRKFNHWCQPMEAATHTYNADQRYPFYFDQDQLYDLRNDPSELENLYDRTRQAGRIERMRQLIREYSSRLPHTFGEFTEQRPSSGEKQAAPGVEIDSSRRRLQ